MTNSTPLISIVIVVGDQRRHFADCLRSVLQQRPINQIEVLVVDCSSPSAPTPDGIEHPSVRHIRLPGEASFGEARAIGARESRANVVAYLEEHCMALPGWAEALIEAHAGPWAGVSGEIYNANSGVGISDAVYLLGYSAWFPPLARGETEMLPAHNCSYKKERLLELDGELPQLLSAEPLLQWRLRREGQRLLAEPRVKIMHLSETTLPSLDAFFWWNWHFAARRAAMQGWSTWKRVAYAVASPIRPWVSVLRLAFGIIRRRPQRLWTFAWNLPLIVLIAYLATLGLALGAAVGDANAEGRFTELELGSPRSR